jgi:hypothetical protein
LLDQDVVCYVNGITVLFPLSIGGRDVLFKMSKVNFCFFEKYFVDKRKKVEVQYAILNKFIIVNNDTLRKKVLNYLLEKILSGAIGPDENAEEANHFVNKNSALI